MATTLAFARLKGRENYNEWKIGVKALLITKGLWKFLSSEITISSKDTEKRDDEKALAELTLTLDPCVYTHIENCEFSKDAWEALKAAFEDNGVVRKVALLKQWISLKLDNCESMQDYVTQCLKLWSKVKSAGFNIDEQTAGAIILCGLPDQFKPMVMTIEAKGKDISVDYVKNILLQEVEFEQSEEAKVFAAKQRKSFGKSSTKKRVKCYECGGPHYKKHCPKLKNEKTVMYSSFVAQKCVSPDDWFFDSGATAHMSNYEPHIVNRSQPHVSEVTVANSQKLSIECTGDIEQKIINNHRNSEITLKNVQYIPDICANLLSVNQIVKKGHEVLFNNRGCKVFDNNKNVLATGSLVNDMFKLDVPNNKSFLTKTIIHSKPKIKSVIDLELWHRRLGHVSYSNSVFINSFDSNIRNLKSNKCETCIKGKLCRLPFNNEGNRAEHLLELVHTDVCGPVNIQSIGGCRYFITFIDDFSRKVFVFCLKKKSQVFQCFLEFKQFAENNTGNKLKILRSDNGTEYINSNFEKICAQNGIVHQTTATYSPQQNGVAERMNRTLLDKVRCMLIDSKLSKGFWAEALMTAVRIVNSVPCKGTNNNGSPEEAFSGIKPDLSFFKVFGCKVFAHVPDVKRKKLDDKAIECTFIGYATTQKAYRLYNHSTKRVIVSRDVTFIETENGNKVSDLELKCTNQFVVSLQEDDEGSDFESREEILDDPSITKRVESLTSRHPEVDASAKLGKQITLPVKNLEESTIEPTAESTNVSSEFGSADDDTTFDPENESIDVDESANLEQTIVQRASNRIAQLQKQKYTYIAIEESDPTTVKAAMSSALKDSWMEAMHEEMNSLAENKTWVLSEIPKDKKAVKCKWVFKTKRNADGNIVRYKARLVAKGFTQVAGVDYNETFSPVVRYNSIRYLLAMAVKLDLKISQMDAVTAFLHGKLDTEIYMEQPELFDDGTKRYCRLIKSIYGLKQSSRLWNSALSEVLIDFGLKQSQVDQCIFYCVTGGYILIVAIYVDDMLILSNNIEKENQLKEKLNKNFKMKDLGEPLSITNIRVTRDKKTGAITIDQRQYIKEIIERFGMSDANPTLTPLDLNQKISYEMCPKTEDEKYGMRNVPYREAVGSLLYAAQVTRPDINFAVNLLSRYNENPGKAHWIAVKRILRYLKGTMSLGITYSKSSNELTGFCDSDWANDLDERRSTTGYLFVMQNGAISWCTHRQKTPALSTTEAEYMSMTECIQEAMWLKSLNNELNPTAPNTITIHCDNRGAVDLAKNNNHSNRTKHIDVKHKFICKSVRDRKVNIEQVSTDNMPADILTKAIAKPKLFNFMKYFGMKEIK